MPAITRPTLTYLAEAGVRDGTTDLAVNGAGEVSYTRKLVGLWSERTNLAKYFLGMPQIEYDGGGAAGGNPVRLRRLIPLAHPDRSNFYAARITTDHNHQVRSLRYIVGDASTAATFKKIFFTVHYETPKFYVGDDTFADADHEFLRYVEQPKVRLTTDVLTFKAGSGRLVLNASAAGSVSNRIVSYGQNRVQPVFRVPLVWRDLPPSILNYFQATPIPWQKRILGDSAAPDNVLWPGTINSVALGCFAPGSLLFTDFEDEVEPAPVDDPDWNIGIRYRIVFNFLFRPTPGGWNKIFYADPSGTNSGYYFYSRSNSYPAGGPAAAADYDSLYNCRDHRKLFSVQT